MLNEQERSELQLFLDRQIAFPPSDCTLSATDASIVDSCFAQLTRAAFRRTKIDSESAKDLLDKVSQAVNAGKPISLAVPFGGYKHHSVESFPGIDWAEVFNVNYLIRYVLPVTQIYEPGVQIKYSYVGQVANLLNNLPTHAATIYMEQFRRLLLLFKTHVPTNLQLMDIDINTLYPPGECMAEIQRNYEENRLHWNQRLPEDERTRRLASAQRNLLRNGAVDLSSLSAESWRKRCEDAAMWCEAVDRLTLRRRFNKHSENIQLVFVRGPGLSVHVGSCDTSAHHFWSGCGVLDHREGRFRQRILSHDKLSSFSGLGVVSDSVVASVFSDLSPTFTTVLLIDGSTQPKIGFH